MPIIESGSRIAATDLTGTLLPQDGNKVAETVSHKVTLASNQNGHWLPDLHFTPKTVTDPNPIANYFAISDSEKSSITTAASFEKTFNKLWAQHKAHVTPKKEEFLSLFPSASRSHFAYNNVVGQRIQRFFDQAIGLARSCNLPASDAGALRKFINSAHEAAFRNRKIEFDNQGTSTYWSYSNDAAFVHVYERLLKVLPVDSPARKTLQAEIDFIFSRKFTPKGEVNEADIERSLGLMMIDKKSRELVNIKSNFGGRVEYVSASGKPVSVANITFRRPLDGEQTRAGMVFDWNGNNIISTDDTSWFGHCDIKASIDCLVASMHESGGLVEFRSESNKAVFLSKESMLEALASIMEFSDNYVAEDYSSRLSLGSASFGGARFDDRPSTLNLTTSLGFNLTLPIRLKSIGKAGNQPGKDHIDQVFSSMIPNDFDPNKMTSFKPNPNIVRTENDDTNYINVNDRQIAGTFDGHTYNEQGELNTLSEKFSFSLNDTRSEPVVIGSMLASGDGKNLLRYSYNPRTKELIESAVKFNMQGQKFVAQEGNTRSLGTINSLLLGKEVENNDNVAEKLRIVREAISSGVKIGADNDPESQVWNGEIHALQEEVVFRSADGKFEKIKLHVAGTFGKREFGVILNELNAAGEVVRSHEAIAPVDFFWTSVPRVAPLIWGQRGKWFYNESMLNRGIIQRDDVAGSIAALRNLYDLIHIGLTGKNHSTRYSIAHKGERYLYDSKEQWLKDISKVSRAGGVDVPTKASIEQALEESMGEVGADE